MGLGLGLGLVLGLGLGLGLRVRGEDLRHQAGASVPRIARDAMHEALNQAEEGSLERVPQLVRVRVA